VGCVTKNVGDSQAGLLSFRFARYLKPDELEAIRAYVIKRAHD